VTDTGIGISPEFLPYIFDRFRQADGSTARTYGGLGLGLAIVRHLIQLHEGNVRVESQGTDQGSTFTIDLPLASAPSMKDHGKAEVSECESRELPTGDSITLNGLRILVVDDEPDSREIIAAILTRCGGEVRCSESTSEALRVLAEWNPDLLVSDIGMPDEDGYSLIRQLRGFALEARQIPAVALTAYATNEDRDRALSAGFQAHVAKPIEPDLLISSIATALGRSVNGARRKQNS
jgi:CheY-like chemotaxis protein